ncbi:MAG: patatin-like phospholipase family protein [Lysobacterales bacterium]
MLIVQTGAASRRPRRSKVGIAIAGGGPVGGMYEVGALCALDQALEGCDLTRLDVYVGVSSGAFLAAGLANGIDTDEICRLFITTDAAKVKFRPEMFLRPAFREYGRRLRAAPGVIGRSLGDWMRHPLSHGWGDVVGRMGALVPAGLFDNDPIDRYLRDVFAYYGRSNDFRELPRRLFVVAVELDTGEVVRFGAPGFDHVPISRAVQASAALPGLYPPVEIDGKHYVDGALRRTLHASVAMADGADLVLALNPLVPFDIAARAAANARDNPGVAPTLTASGLPAVLSQTFRTLLKSRMQVGLDKYRHQYPNSDLILFEPNSDDGEMFFANVFSYDNRQRVAEHAFRATLADLRQQRESLAPLLARHGMGLRDEVLDNPAASMLTGLRSYRPRPTEQSRKLRRALDDLDVSLQRGPSPALVPRPRRRSGSE